MYNLTIEEMAEIEGWDIVKSEEEKQKLEEYWENEDVKPVKSKCRKCKDWMLSTRVVSFSVPAHQHTFAGNRSEGQRKVNVCYYCVKDGWRPTGIRTNHNRVYWKNIFDETNPYVKQIVERVKEELIEKIKRKTNDDIDLTTYGITPYDVGVKKVFKHYIKKRKKFDDKLKTLLNGDMTCLDELLDDTIETMTALLMIKWILDDLSNGIKDDDITLPTLEAINESWKSPYDDWWDDIGDDR